MQPDLSEGYLDYIVAEFRYSTKLHLSDQIQPQRTLNAPSPRAVFLHNHSAYGLRAEPSGGDAIHVGTGCGGRVRQHCGGQHYRQLARLAAGRAEKR